MKRSSSTPNQAVTDAALAEKKRNKLGYSRVSVACGHCRRRKIRCEYARGDLQNPCANCIRLKKECNFLPIGQPTDQLDRPSEAQGGLCYLDMAVPLNLGSSDLKRLKDDGFPPENRGFVLGAQNEPNSAACSQYKQLSSTRLVADESCYWPVNTQTTFSPMFSQPLNQPQHQNWLPGGVEPSLGDELNFGVRELLPPFYFQYSPPPTPWVVNTEEAVINQTSTTDFEPYMQGV
ncbi:hypothetical protein V501_00538 [Pseudogymnoascus sp. VKM F-4519 (FW-2642)]|nr:hypothetical protein V501_00538 [Pseudogymnoascus sp. VKM F-4519 (FW-2642)]